MCHSYNIKEWTTMATGTGSNVQKSLPGNSGEFKVLNTIDFSVAIMAGSLVNSMGIYSTQRIDYCVWILPWISPVETTAKLSGN